MKEREKIERIYMAAEINRETGRLDGPFASAAEAEVRASNLGWAWVLVYAHVLDDKGTVIDVTKRFYQPAKVKSTSGTVTNEPVRRSASQIQQLLRYLRTPDVPPLTATDKAFFAPYEQQMRDFNAK